MSKRKPENGLPDFSQRFRSLRGEQKQEAFADFLGISRPTVGFYENGTRIPDAVTLLHIAKKCGVTTDFLLGLTDNRTLETSGLDKAIGLSTKALDILKNQSRVRATVNRMLESDLAIKLAYNLSVFNRLVACLHLAMDNRFSDNEQNKCDAMAESYFLVISRIIRDIFMATDKTDSYYLDMPSVDELKNYLDDALKVDERLPYGADWQDRCAMQVAVYNERQRKNGGQLAFENNEQGNNFDQ